MLRALLTAVVLALASVWLAQGVLAVFSDSQTSEGVVSMAPSGGGVVGDVNCDDEVNVVDALFTLQYEVGLRVGGGACPLPPPPPDTLNVANCDVNEDGLCNVVDALFILQCEVGLPPGAEMDFCLAAAQGAQEQPSAQGSTNRR